STGGRTSASSSLISISVLLWLQLSMQPPSSVELPWLSFPLSRVDLESEGGVGLISGTVGCRGVSGNGLDCASAPVWRAREPLFRWVWPLVSPGATGSGGGTGCG